MCTNNFNAIYIIYNRKVMKQNHRMRKALIPLIFYFLPITFIDATIGVYAIALTINIYYNISPTVLYTMMKFNNIVLMIRTTTAVFCTVFILPPFREAIINLLCIKYHQRSIVIPLHNNDFNN
ncbi:NADH-ubiquinone oxidoreductase chain [Dirofilaria immitis]